jgi:GNAT acetyltransferase-like protein
MLRSHLAVLEITSEGEFDELRGPWDRIVDRLSVPSPFQSWEWNRVWWRHFGDGRPLRILGFFQDAELVGVAPFYWRRLGVGPFATSLLVPIGWEDAKAGSQLTEQWELLFPDEWRPQLLVELVNWLGHNEWAAAIVPGLHEQDSLPSWMSTRVVRRHVHELPYRLLPSNVDEFVSGLNKSMRDNVRYYPRLLARHGHSMTFQVSSTPADVRASLNILFELHRARARAPMKVEHGDKFRSHRRRDFMRDVGGCLAETGQIRVGVLSIGSESVAAQLWLERGRTMFLLHSGYRPAWANYSVGMLATLEALKDGIGRGLERVEFLRGGGQFKDRWSLSQRALIQVLAVRRPSIWKLLFALRDVRIAGSLALTALGLPDASPAIMLSIG